MNVSKLLIAALVGAVVAFLLGWLTWGVIFSDFFEANAGTATGVGRGDDMLWVPMILGHIAWGLLFAVIFERWAQISTFVTGAKAGAVIGFLAASTFDLIAYGSSNLSNLTATLVDIVLMTVIAAIMGGVIGWMLGRGK